MKNELSIGIIVSDCYRSSFYTFHSFKTIQKKQLKLVFNEHEQSVVVYNENAFFVYKLENGDNQSLNSPDKTKSIVVLAETKW